MKSETVRGLHDEILTLELEMRFREQTVAELKAENAKLRSDNEYLVKKWVPPPESKEKGKIEEEKGHTQISKDHPGSADCICNNCGAAVEKQTDDMG